MLKFTIIPLKEIVYYFNPSPSVRYFSFSVIPGKKIIRDIEKKSSFFVALLQTAEIICQIYSDGPIISTCLLKIDASKLV